MTVTYSNQKFFLQIEGGEQIEISNFQLIKRTLYESDQRITGPCNEVFWLESVVLDGDSFPLPSGIGYRIEHQGYCYGWSKINAKEYDSWPGDKQKVATLYVIEEEKEPETMDLSIPKDASVVIEFFSWALMHTRKDSIHILEVSALINEWQKTRI